jgi:hypothetical protein
MDTAIESGNGKRLAAVDRAEIIAEALLLPPSAISYHVGRRLASLSPSKALVETEGHLLDLEAYARAGHCRLTEHIPPWSERETAWRGPRRGVISYPKQTWFAVEWQGEPLDVLVMHWTTGMGDRPSRFDRKYPFALPEVEERRTYITMWNETLQTELRLSQEGITQVANGTDGFSFAYLKELFLAATMRWIRSPEPGTMDQVMSEQVQVLREQMGSAIVLGGHDDEEEMEIPRHIMRHMGRARSGFLSFSNYADADDGDMEAIADLAFEEDDEG